MTEPSEAYHDTAKQTDIVCEVIPAPNDRIILHVDRQLDKDQRKQLHSMFQAAWDSGEPIVMEPGVRLTFVRGTCPQIPSPETEANP